MVRLIDADVLPSLFDEKFKETMRLIRKGESHLDNLAEGFTEAHQVILKQPTIESESVRHGEWSHDFRYRGMKFANAMLRCSECGNGSYILEGEMPKFCQHCGAKMDKNSPENHKKYQE